MDFNFYKWSCFNCENHPKIQNYKNSYHSVLISFRDAKVGEEKWWRWDCYNWEKCVELEYETIDFWYENGIYFHILRKYNRSLFEEDDFHRIQEEISSSSPSIAIQEVNILLFLRA